MLAVMDGPQETRDYFRFCPGEEPIKISNAICRGRRRTNFPKCNGCQFNDDQVGRSGLAGSAPMALGAPVSAGAPGAAAASAPLDGLVRSCDIAGPVPEVLSPDVAWRLGHATAQYLLSRLRAMDRSNPDARCLLVGHDARPHSPALLAAFIEGVHSTGLDVVHIGLVDTPRLYFAVHAMGACGGAMATGGAEPAGHHGFVICGARGMPVSVDTGLAGIRDIAARVPRHVTGATALCRPRDFAAEYRGFLMGRLRGGPDRLNKTKVVFDAAGGVMGRILPDLFGGVRNLRVVPVSDAEAGLPGRPLDPTDPVATAALRRKVPAERAAFGVAFSPDGSLCAFVDEKGASVAADIIAALIARALIERRAGNVFAFDHRFVWPAVEEITGAGGTVWRERVGPAYLRKRMADAGAAFGADLTGRFYFREPAFAESAALAFVEVLNLLADSDRSLSQMTRPLLRCRTSGQVRFACADAGQVIEAVSAAHPDAELERIEGLTVKYPDWRFNIRSAGSPNMLHLTLEARTRKLVDQRLAELSPLLGRRV